jgi:hypothetical protein
LPKSSKKVFLLKNLFSEKYLNKKNGAILYLSLYITPNKTNTTETKTTKKTTKTKLNYRVKKSEQKMHKHACCHIKQ